MTPKVSEGRYFLAWFLFMLAVTVGSFILGALAGGVLGGILGAAGYDVERFIPLFTLLGFLIHIPVSFVVFRIMVGWLIVGKIQTQPPQQGVQGLYSQQQYPYPPES